MNERVARMAAAIANPHEDTPRLALAGWLDKNGDNDRARFIRVQYEIENFPPVGAKASKAKKEERALMGKFGAAWANPIGKLVDSFRFRRGFVEWVRITAAKFINHGERLFE